MVLSCIGKTSALVAISYYPSYRALQLDNFHHHHAIEESFYFPALEEKLGKGALSRNIEEHEQFVPKLEAFDEWCKKVEKGEVVYDGKVFIGMVEAFSDTMVAHMTNVRFHILFCIHFLVVSNLLPINYRKSEL